MSRYDPSMAQERRRRRGFPAAGTIGALLLLLAGLSLADESPWREPSVQEPPKLLEALEAAAAGTITGKAPSPDAAFSGKKAVAYLLDHQKADGTWDIGTQVNPDTGKGITVGTTALAATALLDRWEIDPKRIETAVRKAADACIADVWRKKESARDFESVAWGQLFTLQLLWRMRERAELKDGFAKEGEREGEEGRWTKESHEILSLFLGRQNRGGGWGYAGSFQTAASILGLREVSAAGAKVPPERLQAAADFLASLRTRWGYRYSRGQSEEEQKEMGEPMCYKDSAARFGACALALLSAGKLKPEEYEEDLSRMMEQRATPWRTRMLAKEGKWPRSPGGASPYAYFAFYACRYDALALREAPKGKRKEWARLLREDLLAAMEPDSTWANLAPEMKTTQPGFAANVDPGRRIYATAMALLALRDLDAVLLEK